MKPKVTILDNETVADVLDEARQILEQLGVAVEHAPAVELLAGAGARVGDDGRVRIDGDLVDKALSTVQRELRLYDRDGEQQALVLGAGRPHFAPGSAAVDVLDHESGIIRPALADDCVAFARLTEQLDALALGATCVVPSDVPLQVADRQRLALALTHSAKPLVTGTFAHGSFPNMLAMLEAVRGDGQRLRARPLAIFDCCPTAPLSWSELTVSTLVGCARAGVPAEIISVPMTGATAPVTLLGAVAQHAAENLSGVVIHQLAAAGAPLLWGVCSSAFDMRGGSAPMAAPETWLMNLACAEVGRGLGLPTHAYLGLSDTGVVDAQAGLESGCGTLLAALSGVDVISGPGMLQLAACQSLEKLVIDHEAVRASLRVADGIDRRDAQIALPIVTEGLAAGQFLGLAHTRRWHREELLRPGAVIDRAAGANREGARAPCATDRAHAEVLRLLDRPPAPPLASDLAEELARLAGPS